MSDLSQLFGRTLVLVAHPDDETVACGALLQRISEPVVVIATNGAPRDEYFWGKYGSRLHYKQVREYEARTALGIIGLTNIKFAGSESLANGDDVADQELTSHLELSYSRLIGTFARNRPDAIVTLAYEGGHPDHDCCSILAAQVGEQFSIPVWEAPLYHRDPSGQIAYQCFVDGSHGEHVLVVSGEELEKKRAMLASYTSQQPFLSEFDLAVERFRPQRRYDYTRPPHQGKVNYEQWHWPMNAADICNAFREFAANHSAVRQ